MNNKKFPQNNDFVLDVYKKEIILRARWTLSYLHEGNKTESPQEKMRIYTSAITYAMSIYRLLYWHTTRKNSEEMKIAKQRSKAIKNKWPNLSKSPSTLREVRNSLEHFEEKMDSWAVSDSSNIFIDSNIGLEQRMIKIQGIGEAQSFRSIDGKGNFTVLGKKVNLEEISKWCSDLVEYLEKN